MLLLLQTRTPQRGARLGAAGASTPGAPVTTGRYPYSPVRPDSAPFVVARGQVSGRGVGGASFTLYDHGTVDRRQDPNAPLNRRWPSQEAVITRQIRNTESLRWKTVAPSAPVRPNGFLLSLQVKPGKPKPPPPPKAEYFIYYVPLEEAAPPGFPDSYFGLRVWDDGAVVELCLVDVADAPSLGEGIPMIRKNGTTYALYLVEQGDPDASTVMIPTAGGVKAVRVKP